MSSKDPSRVLDEISQARVPQDVNLLPGVLAQIEKRNKSPMLSKSKQVVLILLSLLVLFGLSFAIPGVASAARKILGFIPGVGIVEQSPSLRVLAQPVSQTRDGFTVTVENAVLDANHSVLTYKVQGPFTANPGEKNGAISQVCFSGAELRLPDGTQYRQPAALPQTTWDTGYQAQVVYPAVPAGVQQAVLFLPCLHARLAGQGPENWSLPLAFGPAPPELTVYPLAPTVVPAAPLSPSAVPPQPPLGVTINVDSVIPLADGQLLQLRVDWSANPRINGVSIYPEDVKIFDANGQEVALESSNEAVDQNEQDSRSRVFGFKTAPIQAPGPARLVIQALSEVNLKASSSFRFDPGEARQPEQSWDLNQTFNLDGRTLRITRISLSQFQGNASLTVDMESSDGIFSAGIMDLDHPPLSGAGVDGSSTDGGLQRFTSIANYQGGLPAGPLTLTVTGYTVRENGPWQLAWTPKAPAAAAAPEQTVCLTEAAWKSALAAAPALPETLNRTVLLEDYVVESNTPRLLLSRLDGSQTQELVKNGGNPALAPDGSRMVYVGPQGLMLYRFDGGGSQFVTETGPKPVVYRPFWSPDGSQLAFTSMPDGKSPNVVRVRLDGSAPAVIPGGEPLKLMQAWMPDGQILYITMGENGPLLKRLDPDTGQTSPLFKVPQLGMLVAASQDGQRLALNWSDPAGDHQTLYVLKPDGAQRKTLLSLEKDGNIARLAWSPDGQWLLVNFTWRLPAEDYVQALLNVETCQVIPLPGLKASVVGWLK
jgi:hypothetical protein